MLSNIVHLQLVIGGCAIALVDRDVRSKVATQVADSFQEAGFAHPEFYVVTPGPAALRVQ